MKTANQVSAVYWFRNGATKVVNDVELANTFKRRAIDPFWKQIYCIQTIVKAKIGLGKPIYVDFAAPINLENPDAPIVYNFNQYGHDERIKTNDLCQKTALKVAYYIQKIHAYEILSMK